VTCAISWGRSLIGLPVVMSVVPLRLYRFSCLLVFRWMVVLGGGGITTFENVGLFIQEEVWRENNYF